MATGCFDYEYIGYNYRTHNETTEQKITRILSTDIGIQINDLCNKYKAWKNKGWDN